MIRRKTVVIGLLLFLLIGVGRAQLKQMTVEEKAMQLSSVFPLALFNTEGPDRSQLDALLKNGIGHVSALGLIGHKTPEELAKAVNAIQRTS